MTRKIVIKLDERSKESYAASFQFGLTETRVLLGEPTCNFGFVSDKGYPIQYTNGGYVLMVAKSEDELRQYLLWLTRAFRRYNERTLQYYSMTWKRYYELTVELQTVFNNNVAELIVTEVYTQARGHRNKNLIGKPAG